jgi:hypothetical protein
MYGYQVPRDYEQAVSIDEDNKNTKWQDSTEKEFREIDEYETFNDKGKGYQPGPEYKRYVYISHLRCQHDGRHKARLVAGGHLTETPIDSVYSSVVSQRHPYSYIPIGTQRLRNMEY